MNDGAGRMRPTAPPTALSIARALGVSAATVSLALRGAPSVAAKTRARVEEKARELGYVYNRSAASLRSARTHIVAVCIHDISNPFFAEIVEAIDDAAAETGRSLLFGSYRENFARQDRLLRTFKEYRPDGILLCPAAGTTIGDLRHLRDAGVPIVQISREVEGSGLDFVGSDDSGGVAAAMGHLFDLGHRRIAYIGGLDSISVGRRRRDAYRAALEARGVRVDPELIYAGYGTRENGRRGLLSVMDARPAPTAALCFNDLTAFGALRALEGLRLEAGRDFSLIGYDDVREAAQGRPALTSVGHKNPPIGVAAAEALFRRIADPAAPPLRLLSTPELVVRGTTGRRG